MSTDSADILVPMAAADLTSTDRQREVQFEHSSNLADFLAEIDHSLLISTYQAGKLVCVSTNHESKLSLSFQNFDRPMGMAMSADGGTMAVAARNKIWQLLQAQDIASSLDPAGTYGNCFVTRSAHVTGEIQAHEMGWTDAGELWIVNTLFSCLCTTDSNHHFVPRWRPSFITELAPEDRCHLNGLAMHQGQPQYVTAMAETNHAGGWRPDKAHTGCLIDVPSGEIVSRGFAMPHSPRVHAGHLWVLDSGRGALVSVDRTNGKTNTVARFPGIRARACDGRPLCVRGFVQDSGHVHVRWGPDC